MDLLNEVFLSNILRDRFSPCLPIDSIMRLMTVWRITGKIIRAAVIDTYALSPFLTILGLGPSVFLCFVKVKLSVKVKLFVLLLCVCAILPAKAIPEMTYTVSGGTLNPTHLLTCFVCDICSWDVHCSSVV